MKTKVPISESQDDWIDTAELRDKKRRRQLRPISKLLNPLVRNGGYSLAVALNFTQTKLSMPPTKQSTISSFFKPQEKDKSHLDIANPLDVVSSQSESQQATKSLCQSPLKFTDIPTNSKTFDEKRTDHYDDKMVANHEPFGPTNEQKFLHLICGNASDEEEEPVEKSCLFEPCPSPVFGTEENQTNQVRSSWLVPDSLQLSHLDNSLNPFGRQNVPQTHLSKDEQENIDSMSQISEWDNKAIAGNTSTQRKPCSPVTSPAKHTGKENNPALAGKRCNLGGTQSPLKKSGMSPRKSQVAKSKPWASKSPKRWSSNGWRTKEIETESMSTLFTQDSQGFRVIAHRNTQPISPLKERTNHMGFRSWEAPEVGVVEGASDTEEEEMLFTQDSQGNLVIKH